ncbi:MAG: hypothetical protein A2455_00255 [Ignavibacteria bacterium RIFOXYC2_FULL_35_16]|nr:MAG: hypothetical protein A2455_00255 [Ignavibacteria bacterium RIFOXYC2_FULL_35_16]
MEKIFVKVCILFPLCFIIYSDLPAQQYSFKLLTFFGKVDHRASITETWKKVQTGENLEGDSEIRLDKNSYAALLYNDGRTMEMMNEGIFNIKELERNIKNSKMSVTQKFANFIAEEIIIDKSKGKTMKELAAVVRVKPNHIESAIPSFTSFLDPVIDFSWYSYPSAQKYVFGILSSENASIFMELVEDTSYTLDIEKIKLNKETEYKWYVFDADNPQIVSDTNLVLVLSDRNKKLILDTVQLLKEEIKLNETPLNILSLGAFYENKNLNLEALNQYSKALLLAPDSEAYKKMFLKFLLKNKLYFKASKLLDEIIIE